MVEHGLGVSIVPSSSARDEIAAGRLRALTVRNLKVYWELGLVSLKSNHTPPVQATFRRLCQKFFE
jgi:DNA-binding transcriptional LysR family regulator